MPLRIVLATANADKVREIAAILGNTVELVSRPEHVAEVEETADSLHGNALLKAEALVAATGLPAVADDSGLEVDALGGLPGVHSSRYAGGNATYADNVAKLLRELAGIPRDKRAARFRTVALVAFPDVGRAPIWCEGVVEGTITTAVRGDGGFGYDPVFVPIDDWLGRTFAEMTAERKHGLSHRGRAFRALAAKLEGLM